VPFQIAQRLEAQQIEVGEPWHRFRAERVSS
jgi:hypothetical protein